MGAGSVGVTRLAPECERCEGRGEELDELGEPCRECLGTGLRLSPEARLLREMERMEELREHMEWMRGEVRVAVVPGEGAPGWRP